MFFRPGRLFGNGRFWTRIRLKSCSVGKGSQLPRKSERYLNSTDLSGGVRSAEEPNGEIMSPSSWIDLARLKKNTFEGCLPQSSQRNQVAKEAHDRKASWIVNGLTYRPAAISIGAICIGGLCASSTRHALPPSVRP